MFTDPTRRPGEVLEEESRLQRKAIPDNLGLSGRIINSCSRFLAGRVGVLGLLVRTRQAEFRGYRAVPASCEEATTRLGVFSQPGTTASFESSLHCRP